MFSIFENGETMGDAEDGVRLFSFYWNDVSVSPTYNGPAGPTLQQAHAAFNYAFVENFPRLLYTYPFTSYTNYVPLVSGSQLTGTAETRVNDATIRAMIIAGARAAGINGDTSKLTINSSEIGSATLLPPTPGTVNWYATTDGVNQALSDAEEAAKKAIDMTKYYWIAGGLLAVLLLTRR